MKSCKLVVIWCVLVGMAAGMIGCNGFFVDQNTTISYPVYTANSAAANLSAFKLDPNSGALSPVSGSPFAAATGPSALGTDSTGTFLYAANVGNGGANGGVSGWLGNSNGTVTSINGSPFLSSSSYASIAVDPQARFVFAGNAAAGGIQAFSIASGTGVLSAIGGVVGTTGTPVRMVEDAAGKFLFVAEGASGVDVFTISSSGALSNVQNVPLGAANGLDATAKFLYVADGATGLNAYSINTSTGQLTAVGSAVAAGTNPSNVAVSPNGSFAFVSNAGSNDVSAYTLDTSTGAPTAVSGSPFAAGTGPAAVAVDPSSRFVYVANKTAGTVSIFSISSNPSGALVSAGSTNTGSGPNDVLVSPHQ